MRSSSRRQSTHRNFDTERCDLGIRVCRGFSQEREQLVSKVVNVILLLLSVEMTKWKSCSASDPTVVNLTAKFIVKCNI